MTNLFEEYLQQRSDLLEADKKPIGVVFSHEGWSKALKEEADSGRNMLTQGPSATYGGLHRWIDPEQAANIVVTDKTQVQWFEGRRNNRRGNMSVKLSVDMADARKTIAEIIGSKLSKPQLCDLIISFVESHHPSEADPFTIELRAVVERHGSFE